MLQPYFASNFIGLISLRDFSQADIALSPYQHNMQAPRTMSTKLKRLLDIRRPGWTRYQHDVPRQSDPRFGRVGAHTGSIVGVDPQFVSVEAADFHLRRTSPAIAAGDIRFRPPGDLEGKCYDTPPSLGAFR